jgi:ADP-ribose pyrophosphatase
VLIEQFRPGAIGVEPDPWLIETVAGIVEEDERTEEVAHREAREEAGLDLLTLHHIFRYFASPGGSTETVDLFLAGIDASRAGGLFGLAEEGEDVKVHVLTFDQAMDWLDQGRIRVATTIIALQWLRLNKDKIVADWRDRLSVEAAGQVV